MHLGQTSVGQLWVATATATTTATALFFLVPFAVGQDNVGFYIGGTQTENSGKNFMQLSTQISLPPTTTSFSVCCHFKLLFVRGDFVSLLSLIPLGTLAIMQREFYINEGSAKSYVVMNYTIPVREWAHICVSWFGGVSIFLNGQQKQITTIAEMSPPVLKTGIQHLVIGNVFGFPGSEDTEIVAFFSIPLLVPWKVSQKEVNNLTECGSVLEGNLVKDSWEEIILLLSLNVIVRRDLPIKVVNDNSKNNWAPYNSSYSLPDENLLPPSTGHVVTISCSSESSMHLLGTGAFNFQQAYDWCRILKGSLPTYGSPALDQIVDEIYDIQKDTTFWINGSIVNNACPIGANTGFDIIHLLMDCSNPIARHLICEIPPTVTFFVLGNEGEKFSPLYLDKCNGILSCLFTLQGDKIVLSDDGTTYQFISYDQKIALELPARQLSIPIGRFSASLEDTNQVVEAAISTCTEDEFTCNDGSCLPLTQHCDGVGQCQLYEDESCSQNMLISSNYDLDRAPKLELPIQLLLRIGKISDVDISNGRVKIKQELFTSWKDERLRFVQLLDDDKKNEISGKIWSPEYTFAPLVFKDEIEYLNGNYKISWYYAERGAPGKLTTLGTQRKRFFDARVVRAEQVSFNFFCDFDLTIYPFGVYPCLYNISLIANSETDPYFDLNNTLVELPSQRLSLFVVRYSAFSAPDNDTYTPRIITVTVQVLLEGLYGGFILSIFMPCVVITFIGISTLFFAYDNFQDRITVTLSCLIVEAGLYSQVTDIVPISAAPKFIDVFFLYAITRLFITCVNHMYCYRFLIWLDRRRAALAAKKLQFTEDVLSISRASKPLPTHRPTSSLVSCQSSETNNGEPNSKLGVSSMAPKISMVAWESNNDEEKKLQKRYRKFKQIYHISLVITMVFDVLLFIGSCFLIYRNWSAVFEKYPSLSITS